MVEDEGAEDRKVSSPDLCQGTAARSSATVVIGASSQRLSIA